MGQVRAGKRMHYYLNYSGEPQAFMDAYDSGTDLLTANAIAAFTKVTVPLGNG